MRKYLQKIAKIGTTEVRILDRTFNIKSSRTLKLMQMFREEFPQLRFHCEVDPALVTDEFHHELTQVAEWSRLIDWYYNYQALQPILIKAIKRQLSFFLELPCSHAFQGCFCASPQPRKALPPTL